MLLAGELRLELLGGLRITRGGATLPGLASHKGQALIAYLALTRKAHSRDALAGLFWGDFSQEEARTSLRAVLSLLRKVAAPHLIITRDNVAFNFDSPYRLDVEEFLTALRGDSLSRRKAEETLRKAMDLYAGEFLDGFYVLQAPAFDEWMVGQRQWLHGLAVDALHRLAAQPVLEDDGSFAGSGAARGYLGRLLVLEPWREEAHREMMKLMAQSGQRSAALAQYASCRRILLSELGVEPSEETKSLYEQISEQENTWLPSARYQVLSSEPRSQYRRSQLRTQHPQAGTRELRTPYRPVLLYLTTCRPLSPH